MSRHPVLAIDTANQQCSAALLTRDGSIRVMRSEMVGNKHAERILTMIDELLGEAGLIKQSLALVAFGAGPGSFTGLRVACGVAQGIAWGLKTRVAAVSSLEADATAASDNAGLPAGRRLAVMNDARMHEMYCALYETTGVGNRLRLLVEPCLVKPAEARAWLEKEGADALCGSGPAVYGEEMALDGSLETLAVPEEMILTLARLAWMDEDEGRTMVPALAAPLYVRDRVALTIEERARGERL